MFFSNDMKDLVRLLEKYGVRYTLVGGFAVNYYGYVRMTQDIDFLLYPSRENALKIMQCLDEFGFGNAGIPQEYFEKEGTAVHLGAEPNRIDLLTRLKGVSNDRIFTNIKRISFGGVEVNIISLPDLIETKRNSDRTRDNADADELEQIRAQHNSRCFLGDPGDR